MPKLIPVDYDPFEEEKEITLTPVDYDPFPPAEDISWSRELGRGVVRSGAGVSEMIGNVFRTAGISDLGETITTEARGVMEKYAPGKKYQESFLGRGIIGGIESAGPSLAAGIPGAIIGTAVAGPVGTVFGGIIGYALGAGGAFAANEYQNYLDEYRKTFGDEPGTETKARAALSGLVEGGFEGIADVLGGRFLLKGALKPAVLTVKELLKTPIKEAALTFAKTSGIEVGTEMTQNSLEAWLRQVEQLPTQTPLEAAKESIIPALTMTALFNLGHAGISRTKIASVQKALADPNVPYQDRLNAVAYVDSIINEQMPAENKEGALSQWREYTLSKVVTDNFDENGTPLAPSPQFKPQAIDLNYMIDPLGAQASILESKISEELFGDTTTVNPELAKKGIEDEAVVNETFAKKETAQDNLVRLQELEQKAPFLWTAEDKIFHDRMMERGGDIGIVLSDLERMKELEDKVPFLWTADDKAFYDRMMESPVEARGKTPSNIMGATTKIKTMADLKNLILQQKTPIQTEQIQVEGEEEAKPSDYTEILQGEMTPEKPVKQAVGEAEAIPEETLAPESTVIPIEEGKAEKQGVLEKEKVEKEPWKMTKAEYKITPQENILSSVTEYKNLSPDVQKIAREKYINDTKDIEGANPESRDFALNQFFFDKETGKVTGDDWLSHKEEIEKALSEGKPVPPEVLKEYPELEKETKETATLETFSKGSKNKKETVTETAKEILKSEKGAVTVGEEPVSDFQKIMATDPKKFDFSVEGMKNLRDEFYRRYFYRESPVVRLVRAVAGAERAAQVEQKIKYLYGRQGVAKEMLEGRGVLTYGKGEDHETEYVPDTKSLMAILKPINSKIMYLDYESWRAARTIDALDKFRPDYKMPEGLADKARIEIKRVEELYGEEGMKTLRQVDKEHRQFEVDAILRPLVDVGWMSQEAFDTIVNAPEAQFYSSLQREMEELDNQGFGSMEPVKRRTGTEKELKIIPSTESTIANLAKAIKLVATQKINQDIVSLTKEYPDLADEIHEVKPEWRKVEHKIKAEIDPKMREDLTKIVHKLGATVETLVNIGRNKMGMFEYGLSAENEETVSRIKLKFATSEQTYSHELGHLLDKKYGLIDKFITGDTTYPEIKKELRKIADQRASEDSSKHFQAYVRKRPEQIAEFISRYLTQPDQARQLAPNAVKKLEALFHTHSELKDLLDIKPSGQSTLAEISDPVWVRMPYAPKGTITVSVKGAKHYYAVPEDVRKALDYYTPQEMHSAIKILSIPAKVLRAGATLTFDFMVRNPVRDQFSAAVYAKYGYVPFWDFGKGLMHILKQDEIFHEYQASGAGEAFLFSMDRLGVNEKARDLLTYRGRGLKSYNPIDALRYISGIAEMGTRVGVYAKAREKGATSAEAMSESKEATVDFSRVGAEGRAINMMIAFWNANIQGMDIMRRKLFDKKNAGKVMLRIALGITLPSMILWALNHDDERYKELPAWQKDLFWIINLGKDIPLIRIPKPFELGILFGSLPERLLSFAFDKDTKGMKEVAKSILAGGIPGVIPTVAAPVLENVTNYNFFTDRPLENQTLQSLPPAMRSTYTTTEMSKKMGKMFDVSPIKLDNMLQGWTGGLGRQFAELADLVMSDKVPEVEKHWYEKTPMVKGFVAREPIGPPSESVNSFYDIYEKTQQADRGYKTLAKAGNPSDTKKFFSEHKKEIAMASSARKLSETLASLRKQIVMVQQNTTMASGTKRMRIDLIQKRMTSVAKTYNKIYESRK